MKNPLWIYDKHDVGTQKDISQTFKKGHLIDRADFTQTDDCIDRKKNFRENFRIWVNKNVSKFWKINLGDLRKKSLWFIR